MTLFLDVRHVNENTRRIFAIRPFSLIGFTVETNHSSVASSLVT